MEEQPSRSCKGTGTWVQGTSRLPYKSPERWHVPVVALLAM